MKIGQMEVEVHAIAFQITNIAPIVFPMNDSGYISISKLEEDVLILHNMHTFVHHL